MFHCFILLLLALGCSSQEIKNEDNLHMHSNQDNTLHIQAPQKPNFLFVQDENATYLDIFGEISKDILTNQIIPKTSKECDWNWMHLRCEPFCICSYQPIFGDYHLGRSCRLRSLDKKDASTGQQEDEEDHLSVDFFNSCSEPPSTLTYKIMDNVRRGLIFSWKKMALSDRVMNAKSQMCDSLVKDENQVNDGDEPMNPIFEKPVRALRRSLHCKEG